MVANICVYAAQDKNKPVAIIVPAEPALKKLAQQNGIEGNGLEDLVHSKKLNAIVLKELQNQGRTGGLAGFEMIEGVVLADEEWTPANVSTLDSVVDTKRRNTLIPCQGSCNGGTESQPQGHLGQVQEGS